MIIVMGLPGAGKTSVLEQIKLQHSEYNQLNYGTLMLEIAQEKFKLKSRDEIRTLSASQQKEIQKLVGEKLAKEKGKIILDTHCSVLNPDKRFYLPGLPWSLLQHLKVEYLILITGDTAEIAERRSKDSKRTRNISADEISEHDNLNRSYLAAYSVLTGAPCKILINKNGKLEESVKEFCSIL